MDTIIKILMITAQCGLCGTIIGITTLFFIHPTIGTLITVVSFAVCGLSMFFGLICDLIDSIISEY